MLAIRAWIKDLWTMAIMELGYLLAAEHNMIKMISFDTAIDAIGSVVFCSSWLVIANQPITHKRLSLGIIISNTDTVI
jgi:hypothetical protein